MTKGKITAILFLIVLVAGCAHDKWTRNDTYRHIALTTVMAIDWLQTKEIARNDDYEETNPILGEDPSQMQVDAYFLGAWAATTATWRKWFQFGVIGVETGYVIHNHAIGIRISF